jgi:hypothetical protein
MWRIERTGTLFIAFASISQIGFATNDAVPDKASAVRVAEKVLIPIYGLKQIESERPFTAKLQGEVWVVDGYLPPGWDGGVAEVKIDKRNGHILGVTHGK